MHSDGQISSLEQIGCALGDTASNGYQSGATTQTDEAVRGKVLLFTVFPAMFHLFVAGILTRYKLGKERCVENTSGPRCSPSNS